jgi:hypothetical protein
VVDQLLGVLVQSGIFGSSASAMGAGHPMEV